MRRGKPKGRSVKLRRTPFKRVNRYSLHKRYATPYIDYLTNTTTRHPRRNKPKIKLYVEPQIKKDKPNLLQVRQNDIRQVRKDQCKERVKRADDQRRRNFFRSKAKGGSGRPEKNQRHYRC